MMKPSRAWLVPVTLLTLSLAGCQQPDKAAHAEDDTNPNFHAATAAIQQRDFAAAAKAYEAALRADPDVAQAHYELGLLYGDHLNDPIGAMYHFQAYLKARPNSDTAQTAQERLAASEINFAATLPNSPVQNAQAFAKLQSDNLGLARDLETANRTVADLQGKLAGTQKELAAAAPNLAPNVAAAGGGAVPVATVQDTAAPSAVTAATSAVPTAVPATVPTATAVPATPSPAASGPAQAYTIAAGDTLWKIAKKFYPGKVLDGIDKIKAANPDALPAGKPLKIGTVIQIPQ